ncbi:MAG: glycosyltransferase family 2 protein [Planctomycetes bacterium]|nr:glycosyltransferase family 2 protein [Planctomycetota bacterium]
MTDNIIKSESDPFEISVVIPAYNAEKYVARAIDSVLSQTRRADEIIIVDDGSTDGTAEVVKGYGDKVRYIYQENSGASVARNTGINAATGEWIAFLDCDDEWLGEYLERQVGLIERNSDLVWTGANYYKCCCEDDHNRQLHDKGAGSELLGGKEIYNDYFQAYIKGASGWTGSLMIKRAALIEAGLFTASLPMANDIDMWWRIAYRWPRMGYNAEPLVVYHSHVADSITKKQRAPELLCDLIAGHLELSKSEGAYDRFRPCAVHMVKYWIYQYMFDDRVGSVSEMTKRFSGILKLRYRFIVRLLAMFPALTRLCKPVIDKVSGPLGIRR